jgi:hypothetical protein
VSESVRCATRIVMHTRFHLSAAGELHHHPSFMQDMGSYARFAKDVYGCHRSDTTATHTNENHSKANQDRQTDRQKRTHKHTHIHTWLAGVQHIGHTLVVSIILEAQSLHTHKCAQGKNKCDCMLAHH